MAEPKPTVAEPKKGDREVYDSCHTPTTLDEIRPPKPVTLSQIRAPGNVMGTPEIGGISSPGDSIEEQHIPDGDLDSLYVSTALPEGTKRPTTLSGFNRASRESLGAAESGSLGDPARLSSSGDSDKSPEPLHKSVTSSTESFSSSSSTSSMTSSLGSSKESVSRSINLLQSTSKSAGASMTLSMFNQDECRNSSTPTPLSRASNGATPVLGEAFRYAEVKRRDTPFFTPQVFERSLGTFYGDSSSESSISTSSNDAYASLLMMLKGQLEELVKAFNNEQELRAAAAKQAEEAQAALEARVAAAEQARAADAKALAACKAELSIATATIAAMQQELASMAARLAAVEASTDTAQLQTRVTQLETAVVEQNIQRETLDTLRASGVLLDTSVKGLDEATMARSLRESVPPVGRIDTRDVMTHFPHGGNPYALLTDAAFEHFLGMTKHDFRHLSNVRRYHTVANFWAMFQQQ